MCPSSSLRRQMPDTRCKLLIEVGVSKHVTVQQSLITCPKCGVAKLETMPTDACQFFYECTACGTLLRPKSGDCCVFCSYGSAPCPPVQQAGGKGSCCKNEF